MNRSTKFRFSFLLIGWFSQTVLPSLTTTFYFLQRSPPHRFLALSMVSLISPLLISTHTFLWLSFFTLASQGSYGFCLCRFIFCTNMVNSLGSFSFDSVYKPNNSDVCYHDIQQKEMLFCHPNIMLRTKYSRVFSNVMSTDLFCKMFHSWSS